MFRGKVLSLVVTFRAFLIRNYLNAHLFALVYALIGIPIQIMAFSNYPSVFHQSLAIIAIVLPIFLVSVFWKKTAEQNPNVYIRTVRLKALVSVIFWILIFAFFFSLPVLWVSAILRNAQLTLYSLEAFVVVIDLIAGVSLFQATVLGIEIPDMLISRFRELTLRTKACAYFTVIANGNNLEKDISNFKSAMECINYYLKSKFKLGLHKQQDYCNFFKLIALSRNEEEKDRVREALNNFANMLRNEIDLTDALTGISDITGKPIFWYREAIEELDFEVGFRKTLSKNKELIALIVTVIALVFTVYGQLSPIISDYIKSLATPEKALMLMRLALH